MLNFIDLDDHGRGAQEEVRSRGRLSDRFRDPRQRPELTALFRINHPGLDELVEPCYRQHLEYDRNRFWDGLPTSFLVQEGTDVGSDGP